MQCLLSCEFSSLTGRYKHCLGLGKFLSIHSSVLAKYLKGTLRRFPILSLWSFLLPGTLNTHHLRLLRPSAVRESTRTHAGFTSLCYGLETLKVVSWVTIGFVSFIFLLLGISGFCCQWFISLKTVVSYILSSILLFVFFFFFVVILGKQYSPCYCILAASKGLNICVFKVIFC